MCKRCPIFKAFLEQMIQGPLRDVLKKEVNFRPGDPLKLCGQAKNRRLHTFFQNFLDVGVCLKDFKVGVAHQCGEIGR